MSMSFENNPHIRILGSDCTGKTAVCHAVTALMPQFVEFASTDPYVYDWLRTYSIGPSSMITSDQIRDRERVFLAANRVQMRAIKEVTQARPDTLITHAILQGKSLSRSMSRLFPEPYMRPDALVVLTAPIPTIAERLEERGQAATGANSLEFHEACQEAYVNVGNLAATNFPVLVFDTSLPNITPGYIADQVLGSIAA